MATCAPQNRHVRDRGLWYDELSEAVRGVKGGKLIRIVGGDFNAEVRRDTLVIGNFGEDRGSPSGELLLDWCVSMGMRVAETYTPQRSKKPWFHNQTRSTLFSCVLAT